jgi:hypothetical protein
MKKIVASVGLAALGASALQTASAQALASPDASKPWSVSATLRGFYDDNTSSSPNDMSVGDRDSFGFEVSPSAAVTWALQQTTINLGVLYSLKYYDTKPPGSADHDDQALTFNVGLSHAFSEQVKVQVSDSFVVGQEPDLLRAGDAYSTFQRASGDNIRNAASLGLDAQFTPVLGLGFGYDNNYYDYDDETVTYGAAFGEVIPSLSGVLDRMEHRAHLEGLYSLAPETKLLLGYRFMEFDYSGDQPISGYWWDPSTLVNSDARSSRTHTAYLGAQHNFTPQFSGSARAGVSVTDYFNDDNADESWTPYVNATLQYSYAPGSRVQGGISYDRNASDVVGLYGNGSYTLDAESLVVFAAVNHQIDPRLIGSLVAQFQNSSYNGGTYDSECEQFYTVGVNLEYKFNEFFSGHIGYNYDRLESDLGRTFDRNRVYIGVTATY